MSIGSIFAISAGIGVIVGLIRLIVFNAKFKEAFISFVAVFIIMSIVLFIFGRKKSTYQYRNEEKRTKDRYKDFVLLARGSDSY